ELPVGLGVVELGREEVVTERLVRVGRRLRDEHGAASVILGCAGMARYRGRLEEAVGLPVVDPTQAAVGMAVTALRLGLRPRGGPAGGTEAAAAAGPPASSGSRS
ncbi:MAG TPA: aspartate/glutamate racemase family protein, partial [Geminicoccaceae bacterium]|nr:aspartate/glutamate racemase family protein [Geminicoccaceae bacterium]